MNRDEFVQLMEALPMGVFVLDEAGRPHYANGAARKLLGQGIDRDLPPDQLNERYQAYLAGTDQIYPADRAPIYRALSGESSNIDDMEIHREGRRVPIEVTAAPIFDLNGKVVYAVAVFHEITERREAQELLQRARDEMEQRVKERTAELERANEALRRAKEAAEAGDRGKTVFLAGMSHELRTPLNHIIGYSEILEEAVAERGSEDLAADARKVREAAGHLLLVISDILDLAKIETGKVELQITEFPLEPLLQEVAERARPQAERNGNRFRLEVPEGLGTMTADRAKLRQALVNPLSNACRFTTDGTVTLRVELEATGGTEWIVVRVEDTGVGMPPEKVAGLFEGFAQADASAMRRAGGTGLGLAITRRFCRLMGGDASVTSRLGEGTALTLRLPRRVPVKP